MCPRIPRNFHDFSLISTISRMATLSAYELEREKTIAANNAVLKSLGLDKPILVSKHPKESLPQKRRQSDDDPDYAVPKRTTRVSNRTAAKDSNGSDDDDSEHEDDDYEDIPRPVKASRKRTTPAAPAAATVKLDVEPSGAEGSCIVVEAAKTGRSKCRKCLEMLPAGALRVGMETWMVGRQVMTWQHPECFVSALEITTEATGRGKCKQTKQAFAAGERRLSATAHITTNHFKLSAAVSLLRPVFSALGEDANGRQAAFDGIVGLGVLDGGDREVLAQALTTGVPAAAARATSTDDAQDDALVVEPTPNTALALAADVTKPAPATEETRQQPPKGQVSKAKGKVCWRFAGALCFGTLLAAQETTERCFARTHKGNTKTLTKGSASWWMLE